MERQELFDRHVAELRDILDNRAWDEYSLLRSSAIVRSLLLHQVNRQRRRRIQFDVHTTPLQDEIMADKPEFYGRGSGISPRLANTAGSTLTLSRDEFFRFRVAVIAGDDIDVRTAVKFLANVEGGVHPGTPKAELDKRMAAVNAELSVGGAGVIAAAMQGIADVVAHACEPLVT